MCKFVVGIRKDTMDKYVDDNLMILKPVIYGRSKVKHEVDDIGEFKSNGWLIRGKVQSIRYFEDDYFISSDKYYVYMIQDYEKIKYNGLEMSDAELIEHNKKIERERQLKMKLK